MTRCNAMASFTVVHALSVAVLTDEDLVHAVMLQLAHLHRGVRPFINAGAVSSLWRRAARLTDEYLASWYKLRWHADLSHAHLDDGYGYRVMDLQFRAGAYDWTVRVWPALEVVQPFGTAPVQVVAAQLRVPSLETLPESWSRRAEWSLTIHHPSNSNLDFIKYFRIHFASGRISAFPKVEPSVQTPGWEGKSASAVEGRLCQSCDNVNGALFSLGATQKLMRDGFIVGRQLRLSLQIRVNPGSQRCGTMLHPDEQAAGGGGPAAAAQLVASSTVGGGSIHALLPTGALTDTMKMVPTGDYCGVFWCDVCGVIMPVSALHRCSRGCNYDVCNVCLDPRKNRIVNAMMIGWAGREKILLEDAVVKE